MKVTLSKPHTHAGVDYPVGAEIEVNDAVAVWLADLKVIDSKASKPTDPSIKGTAA